MTSFAGSVLALSLCMFGVQGQGQAPAAAPPRISAEVDPRVELLSLVFRLAGRPEYNQPQSASPYSREVDEAFESFRDHAAIQAAQRLTRERGISYDAVMSLAVHLSDVETLGERVPFDLPPAALERRWSGESARAFVRELTEFVELTGFREFAAEHEAFYAQAEQRLREAVSGLPVLDWFDRFFGEREGASFRVVVGLLNGPSNYGVKVVFEGGSEEISPVIGAASWDAQGLPLFGQGFEELLAHEFCHSYTNPIVDRHLDALRPAGERLLAAKRKVMEEQAYGSFGPVLYETLVRACVGRYVLETGGKEALQRYLEHNHQRGFLWTGALVEELAAYEAERARYPDLDAFLPRLAERMTKLTGELGERAQQAPRVVSIQPADGATDVAAGQVELRVEFDRPMRDRSWSVCKTDRAFPQVSSPGYDAERRVFTVQMVLEPGKTYGFALNCLGNEGFQSEQGVALEPVAVVFTTRAPQRAATHPIIPARTSTRTRPRRAAGYRGLRGGR